MTTRIAINFGDSIPSHPELGFGRSTPNWANKRTHLVPYEPSYGNALCGAGNWGEVSENAATGTYLCPDCVKLADITEADIVRAEET